MWKIFRQKKKKERKKRTFSFWLTIYGVLCVKVSSPLHLIWRHSERRVITNPFTFTSHYYLISETMCQSSQRPLILWLPGINICRNTRKARLKLMWEFMEIMIWFSNISVLQMGDMRHDPENCFAWTLQQEKQTDLMTITLSVIPIQHTSALYNK